MWRSPSLPLRLARVGTAKAPVDPPGGPTGTEQHCVDNRREPKVHGSHQPQPFAGGYELRHVVPESRLVALLPPFGQVGFVRLPMLTVMNQQIESGAVLLCEIYDPPH